MNIVTRAQWGSRTKDGQPFAVPSSPRMALPARELWVHHTVNDPTSDPKADARTVQRIAYSRGFNDISYSYLVHPDGTVLEGRGLHVGAHTKERNSIALALSFIGNYSKRQPTEVQMEAGRCLRQQLVETGALAPDHALKGHRQNPASPSECPGNLLFPRIGELRRAPAAVEASAESPQEDDMYAVPIDLEPGQDTLLSIEPTAKGFFGSTETLLLLDCFPGSTGTAWVFAERGHRGAVTIKGGTRWTTRFTEAGVVHVRNDGAARVFGALLVKRV